MRIPTILGLALLLTAIVLAVMLYSYRQKVLILERASYNPNNIKIINITDTQAAIVWQTDTASVGKVRYGENNFPNKYASDDRDSKEPKTHLSHFVTLKNLSPQTAYSFNIISNDYSFPENKLLSFKTAPKSPPDQPQLFTNIPPLRGVILDPNLSPAEEALVFLNIEGVSTLGTFTTTSGSFILPIINLRTADLQSLYKIVDKTEATLIIQKGSQSSQIQFKLPIENQILPPLTVGQNINLDNYLENLKNKNAKAQPNELDLNSDGVVNSLDLSILTQNVSRKSKDNKFDLNKDGTIDQKDIEELTHALQ